MPFTVGAAATTSQAITIIGAGAVRVTLAVPLASIPLVKTGQAADVVAAGADTGVDGVVESVGVLPSSTTTTTTPTYPVTVLVYSPTAALASGSTASVAIAVGTVTGVTTVPNSALTSTGTAGTASVLVPSGSGTARKQVSTGVVGSLITQVVSGLSPGDQVVLADTSTPLPANSTTSTTTRGGAGGTGAGAGGAGGAAGGAGGAPGGAGGAPPGGP